jgi:uncharacterized surface protein with fasciclin (FAS1) repeats
VDGLHPKLSASRLLNNPSTCLPASDILPKVLSQEKAYIIKKQTLQASGASQRKPDQSNHRFGQRCQNYDQGGKVFLNDTIQVVITDIEASNGVIHVIDTVLLP